MRAVVEKKTKPPFFTGLAIIRLRTWAYVYSVTLFTALALVPLANRLLPPSVAHWAVIGFVALPVLLTIVAATQHNAAAYVTLARSVAGTKALTAGVTWRHTLPNRQNPQRADNLTKGQIAEYLATSASVLVLLAVDTSSLADGVKVALLCAYLPASFAIIRRLPQFGGGLGALFIGLLFPALVINALVAPAVSHVEMIGTTLKLGYAIIVTAVVLIAVLILTAVLINPVFDMCLKLMPARKRLPGLGLVLRNVTARIEGFLSMDISLLAMGSVGFGVLIYRFAALADPFLVFMTFNAIIAIPFICGLMIGLYRTRIAPFRFVRRLSFQYVLILMILANLFALIGYVLGWLATRGYTALFGPTGKSPIPDVLFVYRDIAPGDLPLLIQMNALVMSLCIAAALSWTLSVIARRAWREAAYIATSSGIITLLPNIAPTIEQVAAQVFPIFDSLPRLALTLILPAIQSFLMEEVDDLTETDEGTPLCANCQTPAATPEAQYCSSCGTAFLRPAESADLPPAFDPVPPRGS